ncbi:MAG: nucleotide exchange factor GrpE [Pseudomonadales bacterium]
MSTQEPAKETAQDQTPASSVEIPPESGQQQPGSGFAGASPEGDLADLARQLESALSEIGSLRDQALRAQAEAENARRRAQRDVESAHRFGLEKFLGELLPVADSLEKAVEVARSTDGAGAIADGVELSLRMFIGVLAKAGVEQIDPAGAPFDPQRHEAMALVPNPHAEPNSVIDVLQRGYVLNGRLVRAAKVVVSKAPG